jgi:general secretion pathway protein N
MIATRLLIGGAAAACLIAAPACCRAAGTLLDVGSLMPEGAPRLGLPSSPWDNAAANEPEGSNPLWGIPLRSLHEARERPLFSPSRRPPLPAMSAAPPPQPAKPAVRQQPDKPDLNLLGVIVGSSEGYAVFLDNATHAVIRLKTGEDEHGWILRSVAEREAVLEKDHRTAVVRLPSRWGGQR